MQGIAAWLAQIAWPLASRVIVALGFGYVTYEGADIAVAAVLNAAKQAFAGITGEMLQFLAMAGFFEAVSISMGGVVSGLAWMTMKKFALQTVGGRK